MIKRVFRGNQNLQGTNVIVEGLGNMNFCVSRPRLQDTRVFFVNEMNAMEFRFGSPSIDHFRLRSSLLRPTTQNIQILSKLEHRSRYKGKARMDVYYFINNSRNKLRTAICCPIFNLHYS